MYVHHHLPGDAIRLSRAEAEILEAVLQGGRLTVRVLAERAGRSVSTVPRTLVELKAAGIVAGEPGRAGTLRSLVVAHDPARAAG